MGCCGSSAVVVNDEISEKKEEVIETPIKEEINKETTNEELPNKKVKEQSIDSTKIKEKEKEKEEVKEEKKLDSQKNDNVSNDSSYFLREKEKKSQSFHTNKSLKKKKTGKGPFVILENITDPYPMLNITIFAYALKDEIMLPIWVEKEKYLKFKVTGKWCIDKKYEYTDSTGMPSSRSMSFNYGALIGRINDEEPFLVYDELTHLTAKGGPLYLKMNLPKNLKLNPQGSLNLNIYDGTYMEIDEINKRIGWKENSENYINGEPDEIEKELANNINNLRCNPKLFYEKYIQKNQNLRWTEEYLNNISTIERSAMLMDDDCYEILCEYLSNSITNNSFKNIHKNNAKAFIKRLEDNIYSYFIGQLEDTPIIKCKLTKKTNPIDICIQYLLDVDFRNNIFDNKNHSFTDRKSVV